MTEQTTKQKFVEVKDRDGTVVMKLEGKNAEATLRLRERLLKAGDKNVDGAFIMVENPVWQKQR